ncbi:MAG TPA: hypothetical protein VHX14_07795 [Thermoanaerobaculia bacterium]|jgi:hypothetical protein|nr:hypothetical protein [Thermoanaerobaculia bacterium]
MSWGKSPLDSLTAENNEVLRACRDSDVVDYRIDPTMMIALIKLTPAERLRLAEEKAASLSDLIARVRRFNK